jgi:hypothetical protein
VDVDPDGDVRVTEDIISPSVADGSVQILPLSHSISKIKSRAVSHYTRTVGFSLIVQHLERLRTEMGQQRRRGRRRICQKVHVKGPSTWRLPFEAILKKAAKKKPPLL